MIKLSCGLKFSRGLLFILNILFLLFGFTLLGFGIYLTASKKFDVAFFEGVNVQIIGGSAIESVGIILIIVSIITVLLSIFGCLGALLQKRLFLYLYGLILIIIMILELAAFITAMSFSADVRDKYDKGLRNVFEDAYSDNETDIRSSVEKLEEIFECCGVDGPQDYEIINRTIPASCYKGQDTSKEKFQDGCADAIIDWIWDEMPAIGSIIGVVLVLEIFGVIASFALAVAISQYEYGRLDSGLRYD